MIKIVEGSILEATEDIIGHQVNCQGVMGAGLAAQIRSKHPKVYEKYMELVNNYDDKVFLLGQTQVISVSKDRCVANLFGQLTYGRTGIHTSYKHLYESLDKLKRKAIKHDKTVAIPYGLGSGLAGGDWEMVYGIINKVFEDYDVTLYRFK
jgi:O-acetyl-ADP-ribose deacetylase (regulator of RNase III)